MLCGLLDLPEQQHAFGGCQPILNYTCLTYVIMITSFPFKKYIDWVGQRLVTPLQCHSTIKHLSK